MLNKLIDIEENMCEKRGGREREGEKKEGEEKEADISSGAIIASMKRTSMFY